MSPITSHILDTARGTPAAGVPIKLTRLENDCWQPIGEGETTTDGRIGNLCKKFSNLTAGTYKMHFDTGHYFSSLGVPVFYPYIEVVFIFDDSQNHYHIPLLLSPFGYSTYRGS